MSSFQVELLVYDLSNGLASQMSQAILGQVLYTLANYVFIINIIFVVRRLHIAL